MKVGKRQGICRQFRHRLLLHSLYLLPRSLIRTPYLLTRQGATAQAISNAQLNQTAANVQGWVSSLPDNPLGTEPCAWMNVSCTWWAIIGIGAAALFLLKGGLK